MAPSVSEGYQAPWPSDSRTTIASADRRGRHDRRRRARTGGHSAGHSLLGLAADRDTAIALIRSSEIDLALVDRGLEDGWTGLDVARAATENGVAVVFTTGHPGLLPADLLGACGLIEKPYAFEDLNATLGFLAEEIADGSPSAPPRRLKLPQRPARPDLGSSARQSSART